MVLRGLLRGAIPGPRGSPYPVVDDHAARGRRQAYADALPVTVGLGHLRGNFREMLGARHADRNRKAKLRLYAVPDCSRNFRRRTEEMGAARDVGKGLVDGNPLEEGMKSLITLMAASPSRWCSKWPLTKVSCGQSSGACRPGMPPRTPKALAS
jgi:hypothetical protein